MTNQASNSTSSGDPYCPRHGFIPCRCWEKTNLGQCVGCGKHPDSCMCGASSDPWRDLVQQHNISLRDLVAQMPQGVQICQDMTQPQEDKPVKKWADELRETAQQVGEPTECRSAYYYFLERSKLAAKRGNFSATFWMSKLPWTKQEIEGAAELLRQDNFQVKIQVAEDLREVDTEVIVSWQ